MNAYDIAADAAIAVSATTIAAGATIAHIRGVGYTATITGHGGAAAIGHGVDENAARAHLAEVVAFNLTHNDRAIA